jgi:hypothetical protein
LTDRANPLIIHTKATDAVAAFILPSAIDRGYLRQEVNPVSVRRNMFYIERAA